MEDEKSIENRIICSKWGSCELCIIIWDVTVFIFGTADQKSLSFSCLRASLCKWPVNSHAVANLLLLLDRRYNSL